MQKILSRWAHNHFAMIDPATCDHAWIVYSTASAQVCLELNCEKCAATGAVNDPIEEEWARAFDAPSNPYPWVDHPRVTVGMGRML